ncbi:MAG: hypothetical protein ACPL8I_14465 [Chloroflexaceae bacterium]
MFALGVIIAIGSAIAFAILGALTLWGGWVTLSRELPVHFVSAGASSGTRIGTLVMVGAPLLVTGVFGLLAGWRILMVAFGLG